MGAILVVDDDPGTCTALARLIRHAGHHGECVNSGHDALVRLRGTPPDLVILDYMMPGLSGLDVLREARRDPRTADVPIVMYSAVADQQIQDDAKAEGANDYWIKTTINVDTLIGRIASLVAPS